MEQPESDDLSLLAPNLKQRAHRSAASPVNTMALREYIKVLGEKPANVPAASTLPAKPRTDGLATRAGTGRRPQRRYFTIKWRVDPDAEACAAAQAAEEAALDPEALKDALVEQARAQRHALLQAGLRPGTGRAPRPREFAITLPPLQLDEADAAMAEEGAAAAEAAAAEEEAAAAEAAAAAAAAEQEALEQAELEAAAQQLHQDDAAGQYWEAEHGVLAEHAAGPALQPAHAATPGAAPWAQQEQQEQGGSCEAEAADMQQQQQQQQEQEPGTSQRGQVRTPATSMFGRYTPMEGVPERLALLATRGKATAGGGAAASGQAATATISRLARPAGTPAGFTPLEGIPERLMAFQPLAGATRLCSNAGRRPSVDSPVEGLVQQGARRGGSNGGLADAGGNAGFVGFALPPAVAPVAPSPGALPAPASALVGHEAAAAEAGGEAAAADEDFDDDMGGGFDDNGGYYEEEPLLAGAAPSPAVANAMVQTGASLAAEEEEAAAGGASPDAAAAAAAAAEAQAAAADGYGFDAGGDMYDMNCGYEEDADMPETSVAAQPRVRRLTKNPGVRLRNELMKRKSLAGDPRIGRHEVVPGVRRSSRQKEAPLKWWLNEKKEFGRSHKTMPTVNNVVHKVPNTPWQTVTDIRRRPAKKQRQRAPTPHDLQGAMDATAGAGEEEEDEEQVEEERYERGAAAAVEQQAEEEQEEEAGVEEEQQRRRPGSGGRRATAPPPPPLRQQQPRGAARRQQARGAHADPPAMRSKATKKGAAAAGGSKKRKGRR